MSRGPRRTGRIGRVMMVSLRIPDPGRKEMQRRRFTQALAAAGALTAVSPFGRVRAQAQKLRVGVILPRSGYLSFIGQSFQEGADLAPGRAEGDARGGP